MSAAADEITAIEPPRSRDQLELLVLRYNALRKQGVRPELHAEMAHLTLLLQALARQQRAWADRSAKLADLRRNRASKHPDTGSDAATARGDLLRAYKLLSRGVDVPADLQGSLLNILDIPLPENQPKPISDSFADRADRLLAPHPPQVAEMVIRSRVAARLSELEHLAANLGTLDVADDSLVGPDSLPEGVDTLKLRAVVELKQLRLLTRQKSLRQHIVYHMASQASTDPLGASLSLRMLKRRMKMQTHQELALTEQLVRQQRQTRERQQREASLKLVRDSVARAHEMRQQARQHAQRHSVTGKHVQQFHALIEREEAKRAERTAKQRLMALRSNDEDAYIKLLDQTKDTRITHLLKQTNQFLASLAEAVRVQQAEVSHENNEVNEEELEKIDYYEVAHRIKEPVTKQATILTGGSLKEYQLKGLQWMVSLVNNNLNGILADEMGLGKTIQTIALITYLIETKRWPGPFLVIVPLSTITNWNVEFDKWAPSVKKVVYKGPPNARKTLQPIVRSQDFQVLLTTYEYIIKDRPLLARIRWQHMIIDEGHRMKNTQSKLSSTLVQYYHSKHRLILTGTPLQNNLPELWALLNFVLPKIFNSVKTFDEWFNTPFANTGGQDRMELTEEEMLLIIRRLHKVLRPFLLRRLKKDVEKDLPDKVEKVIKCKMSALQTKLYEHMIRHNVLYVGAPPSAEGGPQKGGIRGLNNKIMQLRKICNHPYVFEEVEDLVDPSHKQTDMLWRTAGKFELLDRILPKFRASGHRVLMFFQMTQIMTIMEDYLQSRGMHYLRLDGSTKADERSDMLKLFNAEDSPYFCFLLSTRAGGLGLNLQSADTVIIYDTDWNPFQDLQAQDRAHRIGQTKEVRILRLITANSIEESILDRALSKLEIDGKVIQAGKFDNKSTSEEQEAFLRNLMEQEEHRRENKDEEEEIDEEELNEVLARNEGETELFAQMDEERRAQDAANHAPPRLYSAEELPDIYKQDIRVHFERPTPDQAPRRRARSQIIYDDGLTDEQWLKLQESDSHASSRAGSETPKRSKVDALSPGDRSALTERANELMDDIMNSAAMDVDPPRSRAGIFLKLPSRRQYPDYYRVIRHPISLAEIRKSIDSGAYTSYDEFIADLALMLENARTYNQEGSQVYEDACVLQEMVDEAKDA